MNTFLRTLRPALVCLFLFTLLLGIIYPLFIWGIGQICLHKQANGSLVRHQDGTIMGSELIGQNFTLDSYFHPRPSAAGKQGYDAANSSGSNLGPTSQKLVDLITERVNLYRSQNGLPENQELPADAVSSSGSGLDPHISIENARLQAVRVADARGFAVEEVLLLVETHTEGHALELFGEKRVNVLRINRALDEISEQKEKM